MTKQFSLFGLSPFLSVVAAAAVFAGAVVLLVPGAGRRVAEVAPGVTVNVPPPAAAVHPAVQPMLSEIDASLAVTRQMLEANSDDLTGCSLVNMNRGKALGLGRHDHPAVAFATELKTQGRCKGVL